MNRVVGAAGTTLRVLFSAIWILTSIYALLAYVPFTYRQVLQIELIPAVQDFALLQPFLIATITCVFALYVLVIEKLETISIEDSRELAAIAMGSIVLAAWNLPSRIQNDSFALLMSFVCLVPPIWLAFLDLRSFPDLEARVVRSPRMMSTAIFAACASITAASFTTRPNLHSVVLTLALGAGLGALLALLEQILRLVKISLRGAFIAYGVFFGLLLGAYLYDSVSASIAFFGPSSLAWSFAFATTIALSSVGIAAKRMTARAEAEQDERAFALLSRGLFPFLPRSLTVGLALLFSVGTMVVATKSFAVMDWNGLGQKTVALGLLTLNVFSVSLLTFREFPYERLSGRLLRPVLAIALNGLVAALFFHQEAIKAETRVEALASTSRTLLFPADVRSDIYPTIQARTGLPKDSKIAFPDLEISFGTHGAGGKPFLFVFVIDSLRRDYLSPYNSKVFFTPEIEKFSRESHVFADAFTRYGATGLSEPSIWAGRMFPHMMYPQPFEKINLLHQTLSREKYPLWISRDSILQEILPRTERDRDLDEGVGTQDLDFCRTSEEITKRLDSDRAEPVFVYSQSQNIHVSVLARAPKSDSGEYPGFHAPYAHALRRVDSCFGTFVAYLKRLGIYDRSLIVLTADHGDSLGEEGRFGHAYTIYPEIVRIPLIAHLPKDRSASLKPVSGVAFSTDIAPTIAFLLGHSSSTSDWTRGRSLFYDKKQTLAPEGPHLVMSSYGPVAGLIANDLGSIYIADAINFENHLYQFTEQGSSNVGATPTIASENDEVIKSKLDQLYSDFGL